MEPIEHIHDLGTNLLKCLKNYINEFLRLNDICVSDEIHIVISAISNLLLKTLDFYIHALNSPCSHATDEDINELKEAAIELEDVKQKLIDSLELKLRNDTNH
jgi:hypothetical protein